MKTAKDPRHKKRRLIVKELFAQSFDKKQAHSKEVKEILKKVSSIDERLKNAAPTWPLDKLNRIDLAILRLAVWELDLDQTPPKVIIDEAVELGKEYGSENSASFINGVLGTIYKNESEK